MEIEDLKLVAIERREELEIKLKETLASSNEIERIIEKSNIEVQELTQDLEENQNQITELNGQIQLTNSYAEERRLRQRLTRLNIASRTIRQNWNTIKVQLQRNEGSLEKMVSSISNIRDKVALYDHLIKDLTEIKNQELMESIFNLILKYQNRPEILKVFNGIVDLVSFRIREYVDTQIQELKQKESDNFTNLDRLIKKYNNWLTNPNISNELLKICLRFLDIGRIRFPDLERELQIIENYKKQNPNWCYDDYQSVLNMYIPLRQRFGLIPQECNDLELVLNSMVEELQRWDHENRHNWVLIRIEDMENLIENYIHIYPQIRLFFNPINYHREINN